MTDGSDAVVVYASRTKTLLLAVGALGLAAGAAWIATDPLPGRVAPWRLLVATHVGIPFFGMAGLYFAYRTVRRTVALRIDRQGLTDAASVASAGRMAWDEIDHVVPYEFSGQAMLGIVPRDADALLSRVSWHRRRLMKMNVALGAPPVNIPQGVLPMSVVELAEFLRSTHGVRVEEEP